MYNPEGIISATRERENIKEEVKNYYSEHSNDTFIATDQHLMSQNLSELFSRPISEMKAWIQEIQIVIVRNPIQKQSAAYVKSLERWLSDKNSTETIQQATQYLYNTANQQSVSRIVEKNGKRSTRDDESGNPRKRKKKAKVGGNCRKEISLTNRTSDTTAEKGKVEDREISTKETEHSEKNVKMKQVQLQRPNKRERGITKSRKVLKKRKFYVMLLNSYFSTCIF